MHDALVIGCGPAGSTTAALLARAGQRVLELFCLLVRLQAWRPVVPRISIAQPPRQLSSMSA